MKTLGKHQKPNCPKRHLISWQMQLNQQFDADSIKTLPPDPPINPPEPLSDQIVKVKDGIVCPHDTNREANGEANGETNGKTNDEPRGQAEEEMPPLVDETEV